MEDNADIIVIGTGVAGLSAAVTAAEAGLKTIIVERAAEGDHGGNTRYTEAYLRMKSMDEVTDDFEELLAENSGSYVDPSFLQELGKEANHLSPLIRSHGMLDPAVIGEFAEKAGPTLRWLDKMGVKFDFLPTAFITMTQSRLLPVGGGLAIVEALTNKAKQLGADIRFSTTAKSLMMDERGGVSGLKVESDKGRGVLKAPAVVIASGGFEGNSEMLSRYLGPNSVNLRPVCRGGYYNRGEGIQMGLDVGAAACGDFGSYHAEPVDPRSGVAEPAVFTFPYGILVNKAGKRFTDEAPGTVDLHYETITRRIYEQKDGLAYLILDAKIDDVPNWKKSFRSDRTPVSDPTIEGLARKIEIEPAELAETIAAFNAACSDGAFRPLEVDGLSTSGISPKKSNWARPIDRAPFLAIPIISANVFTFGGLKIDAEARVIDSDGRPIKGLYAAGEAAGMFFRWYTGGTSVLRGAVFGRRAAQHVADGLGR